MGCDVLVSLADMVIMADAGHVAWDLDRDGVFDGTRDLEGSHPALQLQSTLVR